MLTRSQRFARNIKYETRVGIGGGAFREKGYVFPSHLEMDEFEKRNLPYDIDSKLRNTIIVLNRKGYRTVGSCQGHTHNDRGFITIGMHPSDYKDGSQDWHKKRTHLLQLGGLSKKPIDPIEIKRIIYETTGATKIRYERPHGRAYYHAFTFQSLSKRRW